MNASGLVSIDCINKNENIPCTPTHALFASDANINSWTSLSSPQTLVPRSAPRPPADIALTGAALPTGSSGRAWVASTPPTSPRSTSSTIYLRARASAWASSTPTPITAAATTRAATARRVFTDSPSMGAGAAAAAAAAAAFNRYAVKSATASC